MANVVILEPALVPSRTRPRQRRRRANINRMTDKRRPRNRRPSKHQQPRTDHRKIFQERYFSRFHQLSPFRRTPCKNKDAKRKQLLTAVKLGLRPLPPNTNVVVSQFIPPSIQHRVLASLNSLARHATRRRHHPVQSIKYTPPAHNTRA